MAVSALRYHFRQPLRASAADAFAWCTDFGPADGPLFSHRTERAVARLADDTFVLTDTTYPDGQRRRISRLVRVHPGELAWTNTHLDGPFRYSQYWYRIVRDGPRRCHLDFYGSRIVTTPRALSAADRARRAEEERRNDAREWRRYLAPALERDVGVRPAPHPGARRADR